MTGFGLSRSGGRPHGLSLTDLLDDPAQRVSICCECGTARSVSANHYPRGRYTAAGDSPERIATMQQHGKPGGYWSDREPWRGGLELLKCSACHKVTEHAMTGTPGRGPDPMEEENYPTARPRAESTDERTLRVHAERLAEFGIDVEYVGNPQGGRVEIIEWRETYEHGSYQFRFTARIAECLDTYHRIKAIEWAWRQTLVAHESWDGAKWFQTSEGDAWRGIHQLPEGAR